LWAQSQPIHTLSSAILASRSHTFVCALLGVITCQLHENQLDSAAGQLDFLNEVKDTISKTPVGKQPLFV